MARKVAGAAVSDAVRTAGGSCERAARMIEKEMIGGVLTMHKFYWDLRARVLNNCFQKKMERDYTQVDSGLESWKHWATSEQYIFPRA